MKRIQPAFLAIALASCLPVGLLIPLLGGCQTGTTGLMRPISPTAEHSVTNVVTIVGTTAGAVVPAPWGTAVEGAAAAVLGIIAAWQAVTHKRIQSLEAKTNGNTNQLHNT
jgi:hypothetical protein